MVFLFPCKYSFNLLLFTPVPFHSMFNFSIFLYLIWLHVAPVCSHVLSPQWVMLSLTWTLNSRLENYSIPTQNQKKKHKLEKIFNLVDDQVKSQKCTLQHQKSIIIQVLDSTLPKQVPNENFKHYYWAQYSKVYK